MTGEQLLLGAICAGPWAAAFICGFALGNRSWRAVARFARRLP